MQLACFAILPKKQACNISIKQPVTHYITTTTTTIWTRNKHLAYHAHRQQQYSSSQCTLMASDVACTDRVHGALPPRLRTTDTVDLIYLLETQIKMLCLSEVLFNELLVPINSSSSIVLACSLTPHTSCLPQVQLRGPWPPPSPTSWLSSWASWLRKEMDFIRSVSLHLLNYNWRPCASDNTCIPLFLHVFTPACCPYPPTLISTLNPSYSSTYLPTYLRLRSFSALCFVLPTVYHLPTTLLSFLFVYTLIPYIFLLSFSSAT